MIVWVVFGLTQVRVSFAANHRVQKFPEEPFVLWLIVALGPVEVAQSLVGATAQILP